MDTGAVRWWSLLPLRPRGYRLAQATEADDPRGTGVKRITIDVPTTRQEVMDMLYMLPVWIRLRLTLKTYDPADKHPAWLSLVEMALWRREAIVDGRAALKQLGAVALETKPGRWDIRGNGPVTVRRDSDVAERALNGRH